MLLCLHVIYYILFLSLLPPGVDYIVGIKFKKKKVVLATEIILFPDLRVITSIVLYFIRENLKPYFRVREVKKTGGKKLQRGKLLHNDSGKHVGGAVLKTNKVKNIYIRALRDGGSPWMDVQ